MSFNFRDRANELAAQEANRIKEDVRQRDRRNEVAREIAQGVMQAYAGKLGSQSVSVQSNVVTISNQVGAILTVTVIDDNAFTVQERNAIGGFRDEGLYKNLQKGTLVKNEMMDTVIWWLNETDS